MSSDPVDNRHEDNAREHNAIVTGPDSPGRWRREYGADLAGCEQRVKDLTQLRDDQLQRVVDRAIERPPRYLTRILGERPDESGHRQSWERGSRGGDLPSESGDMIEPADFLDKYGGSVVDVAPAPDGTLRVHIQGPTENAHELDDAVIRALSTR